MGVYSLYSATFEDAETGSLHLTQLSGYEVQTGVRIEELVLPGTVDRAVNLVMDGDPKAVLRTQDLLTVLQSIPLTSGLSIDTAATLRYQQRTIMQAAQAGTFESGSNHAKLTSVGGVLCPMGISVQHGGLAVANLEYWASWLGDPTTSPFELSFSQALAQAPSFTSAYTLGPVTLGATPLEGIIGWDFQTGLEIVPRKYEGWTYPAEFIIRMRKPRVVLQFDNPEPVSSIGDLFHAALGSALKLYLRRKSATTADGNVAAATASHAYIQVTAGSWMGERIAASDHDNASLSVPVLPTGTIASSYATALP